MTPAPEFSRTVRLDTLGGAPRAMSIGADEAERAALAKRFGLVAIQRLAAELSVSRSGEEVRAEGQIQAQVTQSCVASGVPLEAKVDEPFSIVFRPEREGGEEEIELSESEMDVVFYSGALIDVGEAVAESLALALDPWPRAAEAETALQDAGVLSEDQAKAQASPFAALKDKFKG